MNEFLLDLRGLLLGLREHEVQYALTGAMGMLFYGYVRNTEDLDIAVNPDRDNLDRVADWLISINAVLKLDPARPFGARERWALHKGANATVLTELGQVDVVQTLPGLPPWSELVAGAEVYELEGMQIQVVNRRTLIECKRLRGSSLDLADIDAIETLEEL